VQTIQDATIDEARKGFMDALKAKGFSDSAGTVKVDYQNANGDQATLALIIDKFIADKVTCIAANTTTAMIAARQRTKTIPIFMMVGPAPSINNLMEKDSLGKPIPPRNLSGVYETLAYIDSSIALIKRVFPSPKRMGVIFNTSEQNSVNAMGRLREQCKQNKIELIEKSINSSNETQSAVQAVLNDKIDLFFALPDNLVFASFEVIYKETLAQKVPIITSEEGLVKRGALIAYGADFYQWGYQTGKSAAEYLEVGDLTGIPLKTVEVRKLVYNPETAQLFNFKPPSDAKPIK
jgi:putative tryptophan/tyrosine transport system substrate-binding protein